MRKKEKDEVTIEAEVTEVAEVAEVAESLPPVSRAPDVVLHGGVMRPDPTKEGIIIR